MILDFLSNRLQSFIFAHDGRVSLAEQSVKLLAGNRLRIDWLRRGGCRSAIRLPLTMMIVLLRSITSLVAVVLRARGGCRPAHHVLKAILTALIATTSAGAFL